MVNLIFFKILLFTKFSHKRNKDILWLIFNFNNSFRGFLICGLRRSVVPFPMWSALPPQSTMRRSDSLRLVEKPYLIQQETQGSPKFLTLLFLRAMLSDPGRPSRILPFYRSFRVGFRFLNIVATCICSNEAELLQEGANLLTAHRIPCVRFVWVVRRCAYPSQSRNTRYGWLAKPYPMETFTP